MPRRPDLPSRLRTFAGGLTAADTERIATVINAELCAATRAAYLTERAESGIC